MTVTVYTDAEQLIHDYLQPLFPSARVVAEIPATLGDGTQVIRVERIGGGDAGRSLDTPNIDVDCFDTTRPSANLLAGQVRSALCLLGGYSTPTGTVADVRVSNFGWRPYTNVNVRCVGMTTSITIHNHHQ